MSTRAVDDLRERIVGQRFYNREIDEGLTVVGVEPPLVLIQYDDGAAWDEAHAPDVFDSESAEKFGLEEGGIDAEKYEMIEGGGPTLQEACKDGEHDFFPLPSEIGMGGDGARVQQYDRILRCKRCGLSGAVIIQFLGHDIPGICHRCGEDAIPGETEIVISPNPEWPDAQLCGACAEEVNEEYEPYEVECYQCGADLGMNEENIDKRVHSESPVGEVLGADEEDERYVYACDECKKEAAEEIE